MSYFSTIGYQDGFNGKPYIRFESGEPSVEDKDYTSEYARGEYAAYCLEMLLRFGPQPCSTCGAQGNN